MQQDQIWENYSRFLDQYLQNQENTALFYNELNNSKKTFTLNLDILRRHSTEAAQLVNDLIRNPTKLMKKMQETLAKLADQYHDSYDAKNKQSQGLTNEYRVNFEGNLGKNYVTPRGLNSTLVNNLVQVQGIVTKMAQVRRQLVQSVQFSQNGEQYSGFKRSFTDAYDPSEETQLNTFNHLPTKDQNKNPLVMEFGESVFKDKQTIVIQELPERTPTGLLPRAIEIVLEGELVDQVKPGDRVTIMGIYKCFANQSTFSDGVFKSVLLALGVNKMSNDSAQQEINGEDLKNINSISKKKNLMQFLSSSVAPSIYGHFYIKKALLLMLVGGQEKNLNTGTHLRGDINILMVGDPSTAKSQLLRYIMQISPLAITTTGRGTSSVGLTAAVRKDPETNENVLEAGAMILADGGVILIDEFDKMSDVDRVAIHEVMEQQTVTIAKAGIHCTLNARCSVLAAANPVYGEYQKDLAPTKNIQLPDSLLSRFDLLFIVLDDKREEIDRKIAQTVTRNHRVRGQDNQQDYQDNVITPEIIKKENSIYVENSKQTLLTQSFLKKYIKHAKNVNPVLEQSAIEELTAAWVEMRQQDLTQSNIKVLPITIRSLESMIRLATAHAKLRLSLRVQASDVKEAIKLMKFTLYGDEEEEEQQEEEEIPQKQQQRKTVRTKIIQQHGKIEEEQELYRSGQKTEGKKQKEGEAESGRQTRQMKKIKTDEKEEAEGHLELLVEGSSKIAKEEQLLERLASIKVTRNDKKVVFHAISRLQDEEDQKFIKIEDLWKYLQKNNKDEMPDYEVFRKVLLELDQNGKIYLDNKNKSIQLM